MIATYNNFHSSKVQFLLSTNKKLGLLISVDNIVKQKLDSNFNVQLMKIQDENKFYFSFLYTTLVMNKQCFTQLRDGSIYKQ